jgi:molybdopterin converting factor small subunit
MKEVQTPTVPKKINVLFFGILAEIAGAGRIEIELTDDTELLKEKLVLLYPALEKQVFKIALNKTLITQNQPLKSTDEVALLAPFAGG